MFFSHVFEKYILLVVLEILLILKNKISRVSCKLIVILHVFYFPVRLYSQPSLSTLSLPFLNVPYSKRYVVFSLGQDNYVLQDIKRF